MAVAQRDVAGFVGARSTREAVFETVRAHPGATIRDVARAVGVDETTADDHLRSLWREDRILRERLCRGVSHYEAAAGYSTRDRAWLSLTERAQATLRALAKCERPMRAIDLARMTGKPVGQVRASLYRAFALGLVRQPWPGKYEVVA